MDTLTVVQIVLLIAAGISLLLGEYNTSRILSYTLIVIALYIIIVPN